MKVRAKVPVFVKSEGKTYMPGQEFEVEDATAERLISQNFVDGNGKKPEFAKMTKAQLEKVARGKGIKVPDKATKATILKLIEG